MTGATTTDRGELEERPRPILWFEAEPQRLLRDIDEVAAFAPGLRYLGPGEHEYIAFPHGGWLGELPPWPFDRPQPEHVNALLGHAEFQVIVQYSPAHPMVPPVVYPLDPEPELIEQTQSAWHVAPGGSLCLLQNLGGWQPEASITELLAKACGWRIEYALMKAKVIEKMSISGIVSDPSFDDLITVARDKVVEMASSSEDSG
jgi:hypothetical protein